MRFAVSFVLAVAVAFVLLWSMQALIGVEGSVDESKALKVVDFVRLKRESPVERRERKLPSKKAPERAPPPPNLQLSTGPRPDSGAGEPMPIMDSTIDLGDGPNIGTAAGSDTDIVPLVRVNPMYPMRALQHEIEGWVEVRFTISAAGTVKNPVVIAYYPSTIFNRAALRAIREWKYSPRVEDGQAVERTDVKVRLDFRLDRGISTG
jgi:protein TonB